uniref:HMG box domain-containing protein n=1 Tax=Meloidogyne incognita TaxID=6306 RepID=A0A914NX69_MELIC
MKIKNNFQKEKLNNQTKNKLIQQNLSFDDLDGIEPSLPIDWLKSKKQNEELKITKKTKKGVRPWSAYALFFRQVQTEIRSQCGNISFGELSKTIANKWERMEKKEKMVYNEQLKERRRKLLRTKAKVHTFQLIFRGGNSKKETSV